PEGAELGAELTAQLVAVHGRGAKLTEDGQLEDLRTGCHGTHSSPDGSTRCIGAIYRTERSAWRPNARPGRRPEPSLRARSGAPTPPGNIRWTQPNESHPLGPRPRPYHATPGPARPTATGRIRWTQPNESHPLGPRPSTPAPPTLAGRRPAGRSAPVRHSLARPAPLKRGTSVGPCRTKVTRWPGLVSSAERASGAARARLAGPSTPAERLDDLEGSSTRPARHVRPAVPQCDLAGRQQRRVVPPRVAVGASARVGELPVELDPDAVAAVPPVGAHPSTVEHLPDLELRAGQAVRALDVAVVTELQR